MIMIFTENNVLKWNGDKWYGDKWYGDNSSNKCRNNVPE